MSEGMLHVTDSRTSLKYEIPIHRNTVKATSFKAIKAPKDASLAVDQVENGLRLFDPGLKNTAVAESKITFSDGLSGLQYRGHKVGDLWHDVEYEDLICLFVWEHLPTREEKSKIRRDLAAAAQNVPHNVVSVIHSFPRTATPMQMVIAGLAAFLSSDPTMLPTHMGGNLYHGNTEMVDQTIIRTLAAYSVCIGLAASHLANLPSMPADPNKGFLYNLLLMMGKVDKMTGKPDPKHVTALQHTWALGAESGPTNSTSAILLFASTLSDPMSCLICALSSGYGPLHFGATEVCYKVMVGVGKLENVPALIGKVKRGEEKLFGYGHRVYQKEDPRVRYAKQVLEELGADHPLINVAMEVDRVAGSDEWFLKRHVHANADLYGVFIYIALQYEPELIPVMMMATRSAGMMAHWKEAMLKPNNLWRPPQFYTGDINVDEQVRAAL